MSAAPKDLMANAVDWDRPIEAVHSAGEVREARHKGGPNDYLRAVVAVHGMEAPRLVNDDGTLRHEDGWRIRNVAQAAELHYSTPSSSEVGPEVVERMIALVRAAAERPRSGLNWSFPEDWHAEARAIVALLPEPADADLIAAREAVIEAMPGQGAAWAEGVRKGQMDDGNMVRIARIARGRALAAGGQSVGVQHDGVPA